MNKKLLVIIWVGVAAFVVLALFNAVSILEYFFPPTSPLIHSLDDFAKCLTAKGAIMYGAYNCPHCLNEKKAFGDSFQYVLYVECTQEPNKCVDAGIAGVPTWVFPDGRKLIGEQGLEKLSQESKCELP